MTPPAESTRAARSSVEDGIIMLGVVYPRWTFENVKNDALFRTK